MYREVNPALHLTPFYPTLSSVLIVSTVYGMTYVDFKNKVVFNGSDLGKEYGANGVIERLAQRIVNGQDVRMIQSPKIINSLSPGQKKKTVHLKRQLSY